MAELRKRKLFEMVGLKETAQFRFQQPLEAYIESFQARNGFSRDRLNSDEGAEFDRLLREVVTSHSPEGTVSLQLLTRVVWGKPQGRLS